MKWPFLENYSLFILIGNGVIWLILRHIIKKIYEKELFIGKWFFVRYIISALYYINWGFACIVLLLTTEDPPPK